MSRARLSLRRFTLHEADLYVVFNFSAFYREPNQQRRIDHDYNKLVVSTTRIRPNIWICQPVTKNSAFRWTDLMKIVFRHGGPSETQHRRNR